MDFRANGRAGCDLFIALCQWVEDNGLLSGAGRICGLQAAESAQMCKYCAATEWLDVHFVPAWRPCLWCVRRVVGAVQHGRHLDVMIMDWTFQVVLVLLMG